MAMVPAEIVQRRLTLADYEALPDDQDYEIIDGVLYVAPSPYYGHQTLAGRLIHALLGHIEQHRLGVLVPDGDLIFDERGTCISPDLMYFTPEQYARVNPEGKNSVIPTLVVEVLSESTLGRDQLVKRRLYAELGVPHYWMVYRYRRCVDELTLGPDGLYAESRVSAPGVFRPMLFPGLEIDLDPLFQ